MTTDYNYAVMTERMPCPFTCCAMEPTRDTYMTSGCMANAESPTYLSTTSCCAYFNQPHPNYAPVRQGRCNSVSWDTCHHYSGYPPEMGGVQPSLVPSNVYPITSHTSSAAPVRLPPPTPPYTMATSAGLQPAIVSSPTFSNGPPSAGLLRDDRHPSDQKLQEDKVKLEEFHGYKAPASLEDLQPPEYRSRLKHRLPRRDRLNFTDLQLMRLEESFSEKKYIVGADRKSLADELGISEIQVKNWYQNRRTRWKRERKPEKQFD